MLRKVRSFLGGVATGVSMSLAAYQYQCLQIHERLGFDALQDMLSVVTPSVIGGDQQTWQATQAAWAKQERFRQRLRTQDLLYSLRMDQLRRTGIYTSASLIAAGVPLPVRRRRYKLEVGHGQA